MGKLSVVIDAYQVPRPLRHGHGPRGMVRCGKNYNLALGCFQFRLSERINVYFFKTFQQITFVENSTFWYVCLLRRHRLLLFLLFVKCSVCEFNLFLRHLTKYSTACVCHTFSQIKASFLPPKWRREELYNNNDPKEQLSLKQSVIENLKCQMVYI